MLIGCLSKDSQTAKGVLIVQNTNDSERFNFHIELIIDAFKLQNKAMVESFKDFLTTVFDPEYTTDILTAAVFQLAETDPENCRWALRNLYDLKLHHDIKEGVVRFATQKLISKGFIPGQDFSATQNGEIVINKNALATLMKVTSASDHLFIEQISQVFE